MVQHSVISFNNYSVKLFQMVLVNSVYYIHHLKYFGQGTLPPNDLVQNSVFNRKLLFNLVENKYRLY